MNRERNVLIILKTDGVSGRKQLSGILKHISASCRWNIQLMQYARESRDDIVKLAASRNFDGVITGINAADAGAILQSILMAMPNPVVFMDADVSGATSGCNYPRGYIDIDNRLIGRAAARHFLSLGHFRSHCYLPEPNNSRWSQERYLSFSGELAARGESCHLIPASIASDVNLLADWLQQVEKPAAVFASWDYCASAIFNACKRNNIQIPSEVSVLGVDDDEFLCNLVTPHLSSIRPDFEGEGFAAARLLDAMMSRRRIPSLQLSKGISGITERASTKPISPAGILVQRAIAFIETEFKSGIGATDVIAHLGVSRTLANLRFQQLQHKTILRTITERRLKEVKFLLRSTNYPIASVISMCGFKSPNYPKNLFHKTFGVSMSKFRRNRSKHI